VILSKLLTKFYPNYQPYIRPQPLTIGVAILLENPYTIGNPLVTRPEPNTDKESPNPTKPKPTASCYLADFHLVNRNKSMLGTIRGIYKDI